MDQFDLNHLFEDFDKVLGVGRKDDDPKRLRANHFMLVKIEASNICLFKHLQLGILVKFNWKSKQIVD